MNYRVEPALGRPFEVDVAIPSLSLVFEYNGEYHYHFVPMYLCYVLIIHFRMEICLPSHLLFSTSCGA